MLSSLSLYDTQFGTRVSWSIHACFTPFKLHYAAFIREHMCQTSHIVHIVSICVRLYVYSVTLFQACFYMVCLQYDNDLMMQIGHI
jgi:hypothetical protein